MKLLARAGPDGVCSLATELKKPSENPQELRKSGRCPKEKGMKTGLFGLQRHPNVPVLKSFQGPQMHIAHSSQE